MIVWKDEVQLWEWLKPRLKGKWTRLEVSYPAGLCDSMGLWHGQTIWLEHKVGKPSKTLFKTTQIDFALDCERHHVPWWCCFGYYGRVFFYPSLDLTKSALPPFWIPPLVSRK